MILMKQCMKHQRPNPFIFCSNYDTGLLYSFSMFEGLGIKSVYLQ